MNSCLKQIPWAAAASPMIPIPFTLPFASFHLQEAAYKVIRQPYCMTRESCDPAQRAQALIKASFQGVSSDFTSPLQACLKAAQQAPPAPPGGYYTREWPEQRCLSTTSQLGSISRSTGATSRSYMMRKRARPGLVRRGQNSLHSVFEFAENSLLWQHMQISYASCSGKLEQNQKPPHLPPPPPSPHPWLSLPTDQAKHNAIT